MRLRELEAREDRLGRQPQRRAGRAGCGEPDCQPAVGERRVESGESRARGRSSILESEISDISDQIRLSAGLSLSTVDCQLCENLGRATGEPRRDNKKPRRADVAAGVYFCPLPP